MTNVFFISDLHFGHKRITSFQGVPEALQRKGGDYLENMHIIISNWNSVVTKRDLVWVLGDIAFSQEGFDALSELNGRKKMVRGNHDNYFTTEQWLQHFETVEGLTRYKGYWISHCPMHHQELRGKKNIHGHLHHNKILQPHSEVWDCNYINVCVEWAEHTPVSFDLIKNGEYNKRFID